MANVLGTSNGTILAEKVLQNLKLNPVIARISTNFGATLPGGGKASFGQPVKVRLVTSTGVQDADHDAADPYAAADMAYSNATVTVNQDKHISRKVNVQEAYSYNVALLDAQAEIDANDLANKVIVDLMGLVVDPAVPNASQLSIVPVGSWNHDAVIDQNVAMDDRKVQQVGRFGLLKAAYHGALRKDQIIVSNDSNPGSNAVSSGEITKVDNVDFIKFPSLPANGETLEGVMGTMDAFALATIIPDMAALADAKDIPADAKMTVVGDPSGLQLLLVEKINAEKGYIYRSLRLMYGVGLGNTNNIQKITSTDPGA